MCGEFNDFSGAARSGADLGRGRAELLRAIRVWAALGKDEGGLDEARAQDVSGCAPALRVRLPGRNHVQPRRVNSLCLIACISDQVAAHGLSI